MEFISSHDLMTKKEVTLVQRAILNNFDLKKVNDPNRCVRETKRRGGWSAGRQDMPRCMYVVNNIQNVFDQKINENRGA